MSTIATANNLSDLIDFDCPFMLTPAGSGAVELHYMSERPADFRGPRSLYAPTVEHSYTHDVLINGHAPRCECGYCHWEPLTGHSGQHGYRGAVMHASEFIGGALALDLLDTASEHPIYVVSEVGVVVCEEDCCADRTDADAEVGLWEHEPVGWAILRLRA